MCTRSVAGRIFVAAAHDRPQQIAVGDDAARLVGQHAQQVVLGRRQVHLLPVADDLPPHQVDLDVAGADVRRVRPESISTDARRIALRMRASSSGALNGLVT